MPAAARKVIVSCAVTGAVHIPSQSPYLPITPEQIAENAIGAAEAGAAILHPVSYTHLTLPTKRIV